MRWLGYIARMGEKREERFIQVFGGETWEKDANWKN
jgi:hypothetical protein